MKAVWLQWHYSLQTHGLGSTSNNRTMNAMNALKSEVQAVKGQFKTVGYNVASGFWFLSL